MTHARSLALATLIALSPAIAFAKAESRSASGFQNIALGVPANLELRQGGTEGVSISGDDEIVARVETVVEGGTLKIRWLGDRSPSGNVKKVDIVVNARTVEALTVGGSGRIHAVHLAARNLRATIGGAGDIAIDQLEAESARATIAGSGHLQAAGRADSLDATLSGSGRLAAGKLATLQSRITIQGSAQATVWAKESLNATIAGSGEVMYYGKPQVKQTVAGSGSIRSGGDAP